MNKKHIYLKSLLLIAFLSACATTQPPAAKPVAEKSALKQSSQDWARMPIGGNYHLVNNVWNKDAALGPYEQVIFSEDKANPTFGWRWKWPATKASVVSYPEVIYGDKPWDAQLNLVKEFPFTAGSKRLVVDYDVSLTADGVYNMAFEFWPVSALPGNKNNITSEVMVWIAYQGESFKPTGQKLGILEVDGNSFEIYTILAHGDDSGANSNKWDYIAFIPQKPILRGPLDLSVFIDYLLEKGIMKKEQWITGLEFGNEIQTGSGEVKISNYRVSIQ